jgi:hypothetical protein
MVQVDCLTIFFSKMRVTPDVEPGFLRELLPKDAPRTGEKWEDIFKDFENKIMPGVSNLRIFKKLKKSMIILYFEI